MIIWKRFEVVASKKGYDCMVEMGIETKPLLVLDQPVFVVILGSTTAVY